MKNLEYEIDEEDVLKRYAKGVDIKILAQLNACRICDIVDVLAKNNIEIISPSRNYNREGNKKKTRCIETGKIFNSAADAARSINLQRETVSSAICYNRTAGGYHWEYVR